MPNQNIFFPKKSHHGYFDKALNRWFNDKTEKRNYMNTHSLREDGSMETQRHRKRRIVEEINMDREKRGQKTMTTKEIMGDLY